MLEVVSLNLKVAWFGFSTETSAIIVILDPGWKTGPLPMVVLRFREILLRVMIGSFTLKTVKIRIMMVMINKNTVPRKHIIKLV